MVLNHPTTRKKFKPPLKSIDPSDPTAVTSKYFGSDDKSNVEKKQTTLKFPLASVSTSCESSSSSSPSPVMKPSTKPPTRKPFKTPFKTPFKEGTTVQGNNAKDAPKPSTEKLGVTPSSSSTKPKTVAKKQATSAVNKSNKKAVDSPKNKKESESETEDDDTSGESDDSTSDTMTDSPLTKPKTKSTPKKIPLTLTKSTNVNTKTVQNKKIEKSTEEKVENPKQKTPDKTVEQTIERPKDDKKESSSSLSLSLENEIQQETRSVINHKETSNTSNPSTKQDSMGSLSDIVEISDSSLSCEDIFPSKRTIHAPILLPETIDQEDEYPIPGKKKKKSIIFKPIQTPEVPDDILDFDLIQGKKITAPKWKSKKTNKLPPEPHHKQVKISKFFKKEEITEENAPHKRKNYSPLQLLGENVTPEKASPSLNPCQKKIKPEITVEESDNMILTPAKPQEEIEPLKLFEMEYSPEPSIVSVISDESPTKEQKEMTPPPKAHKGIVLPNSLSDSHDSGSLLSWSDNEYSSKKSDIDDSQMITFTPPFFHGDPILKKDPHATLSVPQTKMSLSPLIDILVENPRSPVPTIHTVEDCTLIPIEHEHDQDEPKQQTFDEESTSVDFAEKLSITPPISKHDSKRTSDTGFLNMPYSIDLGATPQIEAIPALSVSMLQTMNPPPTRPATKTPIKPKAFGRRRVFFKSPNKEEHTKEEETPTTAVQPKESVFHVIASNIDTQGYKESSSAPISINSYFALDPGVMNNEDLVLRSPPSVSSSESSLEMSNE